MIYTTQLVVWQVLCTAGLVISILSLRFRVLVLRSVSASPRDSDLIDGAQQNQLTAIIRTLSWVGLFLLGLLAQLDLPTPELTAESTVLGQVIGWLLIASIVAFGWMTTIIYAYSLRKWWESPISSLPDAKAEPSLSFPKD